MGARFIATNPDPTGPTPDGPLPATGSVAALISRATGVDPYFVGKPNPLMMRSALNAIDAHSESAAMVGDRMDTDVVSGLEAGMHTVLVLTGSTSREDAERYPYRPSRIVDSIADLVDELGVARYRPVVSIEEREAESVAERLRAVTETLESIVADRGLLASLSVEERTRLLAAAADVHNPDLEQRRRWSKASRRREKARAAAARRGGARRGRYPAC